MKQFFLVYSLIYWIVIYFSDLQMLLHQNALLHCKYPVWPIYIQIILQSQSLVFLKNLNRIPHIQSSSEPMIRLSKPKIDAQIFTSMKINQSFHMDTLCTIREYDDIFLIRHNFIVIKIHSYIWNFSRKKSW